MEDRLGNSNGAGIPKKSRSLDLKTLYKSSVSKDSVNKKGLKRKSSSEDGDAQQHKQDRKSRKVVSLSSFEKFDSDDGKIIEKACNGDLTLHDLKDSKVGFSKKLSNGGRFSDNSLGLSGSLINIPRRRRGFVGRNKFENRQGLSAAEKSTDRAGLVDPIPNSADEESTLQAHICKIRQQKGLYCSGETIESDSAVHLKREDEHSGECAANNGEEALKNSQSNHRKRKALALDRKSVEKDAELSAETPCRTSGGLREEDEENLEANAARMLSSRFDPSCTVFSSNSKVPFSPSMDRLPSPSSAQKSTSVDPDDRKLRPRKNHKEKGTTRKRRHFYEISSSDVDSDWLLNKRLKIFWPLDESWYYGLVDEYDKERKLHHVKYDDRDEEWINLRVERFKILLLPAEVPGTTKRKRRTGYKSSHKIKGDLKSGKGEEKPNLALADNSSMEDMESEPIITWLSRSADLVKSSAIHALKKRKTSATTPSNEPAKADGSVVGVSVARDSMRTSTGGSPPSYGLANARKEKESTSKSSSCPKGRKLPIVYCRRRFSKNRKAMCLVSGGNNVGVFKQHEVSRTLDPDSDFWPIDASGGSELYFPWKESKQFGFYLKVPLVSVVSYSFITENVWLLHAAFLLDHGTVTTMWPMVRLEMLFLDNLVGLKYLCFEGSIMEALAFIFRVLTVFHQPDEQGKNSNMQLPVSSVGFRLTCIPDRGKHLAFALYTVCEMKDSRWTYLEQKIKRHSLVTRQVPLSECTYGNIQALQHGQSVGNPVPGKSSTAEGIQRRSGLGFSPMLVSRASSCIKPWPSSVSDKKQLFIPRFALSFGAVPTVFLSLYLKTPNINFLDHDSVHVLETSSNLIVEHSSNVEDGISRSSENATGSNIRALQEDGTCMVTPKSEKRIDGISNINVGEHISSPQKCQNNGPITVSSSIREPQEAEDGASVPESQHLQSESGRRQLPSIDRPKTGTGSNHRVNHIRIEVPQSNNCQDNEVPQSDHCQDNGSNESHGTLQQSTDLALNMHGGIIPSPNPTAPRSAWHRSRSSSSPFGYLSHGWSDVKGDSLRANLRSGPKKPRTQVSYSLPSGDFDSRDKGYLQKGVPHKRIRRSSDRKSTDVSKGPQKDLESSSCDANVLVTIGDRGWRECGARIVLEPFDDNEWKLAIKLFGTTRYSYKAHQFLQPGSVNRFTHAMMWKGGKDWILEFPDRSQWALFKEIHEECYNRNLRAASVRHIPIPGVRMIEDNDENGTEVAFSRSTSYFRQTEDDVEMALDPSHVLYDMDSDDERWLLEIQKCSEYVNCGMSEITEEMFEKVMYIFEKAAYVQQRDEFTSNEIEEFTAGAGPMEINKRIYERWRTKRQRKGMPLVRHLQPPLWQRYRQQLKDWELAVTKTNTLSSSGTQEIGAAIEKPATFAFCLKPRGLEVPNKGSKHRSQKKISVYNTALGDHDGLHTSGRRLGGFASDEKFSYSGHNYEFLEESPWHEMSPRVFSPRDLGMGYFSASSDGYDWGHQHKFQRSKSKKIGSYASGGDSFVAIPYNQRMTGKRNRTDWLNMNRSEWSYSNESHRLNPEELDSSDLEEFRLYDAASAAKRASALAKLKRERAERLHYRADIAIQKAAAALMTAEAMKAACEDSDSGLAWSEHA